MQHLLKKNLNYKYSKEVLNSYKSFKPSFNPFSVTEEYKPKVKKVVMDGNNCAAYVAYGFSENSFIYPISPSSSMGDHMDKFMSEGKKNMFGQTVECVQMQSEGGAAGALHGAIASGSLTSTFTASQGLLLMIPNMYLMAGEFAPTVIHVASRTIAKHALSIFNDHSDVMATRQTGFAMLCSSNVQEVHDMGIISHIATLKTSIPFLHFFDGWQTSHSIQNVELLEYQDMKLLFPHNEAKKNLRDKALTSINPISRGTGQRPDIFFQHNVAGKKYYDVAPDIIQESMDQFAKLTGRQHKLFGYYGHESPDMAIVLMGSGAQSCKEVIDYLNTTGQKVGMVQVNLYRPWSEKHFLEALPKTVKRMCVLDKTREEGGIGNPLYLDTLATMNRARPEVKLIAGVYGIASKNFTPDMINTVFKNLAKENPKHHFTVGINDDVTHTSLDIEQINENITPKGVVQCINWGFGGDGSVGAMNSTTKIIADQTENYVQLFHSYDSKKEGGATVSHLRFGPKKITSEYLIDANANFITCTKEPFVRKYDLLKSLKQGGVFLLNTPDVTIEQLESHLPPKLMRDIAKKNAVFYTIDAGKVAKEVGMAKRTNTVMQVSFFALALGEILPKAEALELLKNDIRTRFKLKGDKIINKNLEMVEKAEVSLKVVDYPKSWATMPDREVKEKELPDFVKNIMNPVLALQGDSLPVSTFEAGGLFPQNTVQYEKRGVALEVPVWLKDNCTQCNYCAMVCPHAVIRPFLLTRDEKKNAPQGYETIKATGGTEFAGLEYTIQVSPFDCTGCAVCVQSCPDDALVMTDFREVSKKTEPFWDYSVSIPVKDHIANPFTVKGSQFLRPYFEFSGACAGCGETPYMKLVTQLYGKRMIIANASGCSSVWGGTATTSPWVIDEKSRGPAWARSLFEDNAEYGLGIFKAHEKRRNNLIEDVKRSLVEVKEMPSEIKACLQKWLDNTSNVEVCDEVHEQMDTYFDMMQKLGLHLKYPVLNDLEANKKLFVKESHWLVGGDGWAYDIGYGGLDHILSKNQNINILIFDTEMYSNTGGQMSKATTLSTSIKFALAGKRESKKDLGLLAMQYGNVYVASLSMGASYNQTLQAIKEAEAYPGTSVLLCLSPCIDWGFSDMKQAAEIMKEAVECGYWSLYRFNPLLDKPLTVDSKKIRGDLFSFLAKQGRFEKLVRVNKEMAENLHDTLKGFLESKQENLIRRSMDDQELFEYISKKLGENINTTKAQLVLYGSETGTAASLANSFADEMKGRGLKVKCMAMDDYDIDELPNEEMVYFIAATCGEGALPGNMQFFTKALENPDLDLTNVNYAVFGLGDKSYTHFNEAALVLDRLMGERKAKKVFDTGLGDDKDEEKYETQWYEWYPNLAAELKWPEPPQEVQPPKYNISITTQTEFKKFDTFMPAGTKLVPLLKNRRLSPDGYDRDVRHYEFDIRGKNMGYGSGDCLSIQAHNNKDQTWDFLNKIGINPNNVLDIAPKDGSKLVDLPSKMPVGQLFQQVLDVFGRPSRRFYEFLSMVATDEGEKATLKHILSKEGKPEMKGLIAETTTYADLFLKFPSTIPKLEYLIQYIAPIKPRLYSIASHPDWVGEQIHLCVISDDWKTPSGKFQEGLCSNYLRKLEPGQDEIVAKLYPSSITIHEDQTPPIYMIALGTGIAPMRALMQERKAAKERGEPIGPMTLLFGSRTKKGDFLYEQEIMNYQKEGLLTNVVTAFSRDQAHKIYVQHRVKEQPEIIHDYLYKNRGYFYLCGIGGPEEAVKTEVRQAIKDGAKLSDAEADQFMFNLAKEGRFNFETW